MPSEQDLKAVQARAERFKRWYEDDGLKDAFDSIERQYFEAFKRLKPSDDDGRFKLQTATRIIEDVRTHVVQMMTDGKIAKNEIDRLKRGRDRKFKLVS